MSPKKLNIKKIALWAGLILIAYGLLAAIMFKMQRSLIYHSLFIAEDIPNNVEVVSVTTQDGLDLDGWYIPTRDVNRPVILHFHGNVGNVEWRYSKMVPYVPGGYNLLLAEYRGYNGNPGKPTEEGLYKDALAYFNFLVEEKGFREDQIILYGESLGSGVVTQLATERNEAAVVLEAPYTSLPDVAKQTYFFLPVHLLMLDQFRSIDKIDRIDSPLFIVHGTKDMVINVKQGKALFEAANKPKDIRILSKAGHNDLYDHEAPLHIINFLSTLKCSQPLNDNDAASDVNL